MVSKTKKKMLRTPHPEAMDMCLNCLHKLEEHIPKGTPIEDLKDKAKSAGFTAAGSFYVTSAHCLGQTQANYPGQCYCSSFTPTYKSHVAEPELQIPKLQRNLDQKIHREGYRLYNKSTDTIFETYYYDSVRHCNACNKGTRHLTNLTTYNKINRTTAPYVFLCKRCLCLPSSALHQEWILKPSPTAYTQHLQSLKSNPNELYLLIKQISPFRQRTT